MKKGGYGSCNRSGTVSMAQNDFLKLQGRLSVLLLGQLVWAVLRGGWS